MHGVEVKTLDVKKDERGWLAEVIRKEELVRGKEFGQFMMTTAYPGYVKGNHYHTRKYEWYCVLKGEAKLALVDINSGEREELLLNENQLKTVRIPPHVSHAIENIGTEMMYLLIYIDEPYNDKDPDTFYEKIL
jgi:UDP-2-acetamido-2,6-beta-L-arabino-hexul-4-ose reductase